MRRPRSQTKSFLRASLFASIATLVACGVTSRRDGSVLPSQVMKTDDCHLQAYFDDRRAAGLPSASANDESSSTNSKGENFGEGTYELNDPMIRRRFAQLLKEEYNGVDPKTIAAVVNSVEKVTVHARWWDSGFTRRLRADPAIVLHAGGVDVELPANVCLGDILFGDSLYARRAKWQRGEIDRETDRLGGIDDSDLIPSASVSAAVSASSAPSVAPTPSVTAEPSASASASAAPSASASAAPKTKAKTKTK
jgi:hypothetical protein